MEKNAKVYIRNKWIYHTPLLKLDDCVDNAMDEFAKEIAIDFFKWYAVKMMDFLTYLKDIKPQVTSDEIEEKLIEFEGQTLEKLFKLYKKENT